VAASDGIPDSASVSATASVLIVNDFIVHLLFVWAPDWLRLGFLSLLVNEQPRCLGRCSGPVQRNHALVKAFTRCFHEGVRPTAGSTSSCSLSERISHLSKWVDCNVATMRVAVSQQRFSPSRFIRILTCWKPNMARSAGKAMTRPHRHRDKGRILTYLRSGTVDRAIQHVRD
jgi:hypothetical protein